MVAAVVRQGLPTLGTTKRTGVSVSEVGLRRPEIHEARCNQMYIRVGFAVSVGQSSRVEEILADDLRPRPMGLAYLPISG